MTAAPERVRSREQMRNGLKLIKFAKGSTMLDDAPWEWGSTGGWCNDMPEFFQGMPNGVYDNIWEDLDDSPVTWHIVGDIAGAAADNGAGFDPFNTEPWQLAVNGIY